MGEKKKERVTATEIEVHLEIKKPGGTYYSTTPVVGKKETLNGQFSLSKARTEASTLIRKVWEKVNQDLNDLITQEDLDFADEVKPNE